MSRHLDHAVTWNLFSWYLFILHGQCYGCWWPGDTRSNTRILVIIGSGNGLAPVWCQAITSTNDDLLDRPPGWMKFESKYVSFLSWICITCKKVVIVFRLQWVKLFNDYTKNLRRSAIISHLTLWGKCCQWNVKCSAYNTLLVMPDTLLLSSINEGMNKNIRQNYGSPHVPTDMGTPRISTRWLWIKGHSSLLNSQRNMSLYLP